MVALPGIVEDLTAQSLVHRLLISINTLASLFLHDAVDFFEAVVGPETVVEREGLISAGLWIVQLRGRTLHLDAAFGIALDLTVVEWPNAHRNFDTHYCVFFYLKLLNSIFK